MTEEQANAVASALSGTPWQSGGDIWLVIVERKDGSIVVISDESICVYANQECLDGGQPDQFISLDAANAATS